MWDIVGIDPTSFNVVSDLIATVIAGLLVGALGFVYPYLVWSTVKSGRGVGLESLLHPPGSLLEAAVRFYKDGAPQLMLSVTIILLIATIAHPLADIFLEFKSVEVGENQVNLGTNKSDRTKGVAPMYRPTVLYLTSCFWFRPCLLSRVL